ncbi:MAG: ABC transporter substrate-binding protein [ANME-2 cluster archaeon]|nr:MAG: ABC transporter substrate-binding protein [ANME-2 cluster archaeon]
MFGGGPAIVEAFEKGKVDIGYIGLPPVMIGIDRGVPITCVGGGHVEGTVMIGPPGTQSIEELGGDAAAVLEQFKGGVIGSPPSGSIHDVIIRDLIKTKGLTDSIEVMNFPWADFIPEALADGEIDAAIGTPPLSVSAAQSSGARVLIPPSKLWPWNPSYGIIVSRDLLQKEPGLVEGFLRLHEDASNLIRNDLDRAAGLVSELVQVVDIEFVKETYAISPKYCASLPREYIVSSMAFVPVLRNLGYIGKHLKEDAVFDTSIIQKIHSDLPHYL